MTGHVPVLLSETIAGLGLAANASCIDGTLGGGGHAEALLNATGPKGRLLGLDHDAEAIARTRQRLAPYGDRVVLAQANFRDIAQVAATHGFTSVDAVLLDLGVSSYQLAEAERGFSFLAEGPLDMRMDLGSSLTAAEIVNEWPQGEIADLIYQYGEEPRSRRIARAIVEARPFSSTRELAQVVSRAIGGKKGRIHPATRTFQALRIAVNDELGALTAALPQITELLRPGGRFAIITFHSLEDRIVKHFIQQESKDCWCPPDLPVCVCGHRATLRPVTRKPIVPGENETADNVRSRSAKLRIAERITAG